MPCASRGAAASSSGRCPRSPSVGRSRPTARTRSRRKRPRTPATTPTRPATDWVRRIRPMIDAASSTCIAGSRRPRLVTCGAPATAARSGDRHMRATSSLSACGMHVSVGIGDCDELVARLAEAGVQPVGLAAVDRVADHPAAQVTCACLERCGLGGVGRAVVEDDHLELWIVDGDCGRDAGRDHGLLVVGGDQHRDSGPASGGCFDSMSLVEDAEDESSGDPGRSRCTPARARRTPAAAQPVSTYRRSCLHARSLGAVRVQPARRGRSTTVTSHPEPDRPRVLEVPRDLDECDEPEERADHNARRLPPSAKPGAAARSEPTRLGRPGAWRRADLVSLVEASRVPPACRTSRRAGLRTPRFRRRPSARMARRAALAPSSSGSRTRTPRAGRGAPRCGARRAPCARQSGWRPCRCPLGPGPRAPSRSLRLRCRARRASGDPASPGSSSQTPPRTATRRSQLPACRARTR